MSKKLSLNLAALLPPVRFVENGDGTITDDLTGIVWEKRLPTRWIQPPNGGAMGHFPLHGA